tara:strand:+ start:770 stop:949 length:180 start_codon:yes stop_codon:yes gene_type:complete
MQKYGMKEFYQFICPMCFAVGATGLLLHFEVAYFDMGMYGMGLWGVTGLLYMQANGGKL